MLDANLESYENMRQNLEANEIDADEIPVVLQYNKRDLPNALPIEILNERMNPHNYPFYEAIAVKGIGVEDTLKAVTKLVFKSLSVRYGDGAAAPSPPGRAPGPPRSMPAPVPPTPAPPLALSTDDLLGELDLGVPEPEEVLVRPRPPSCRRSSSTRTRPSGRSIRSDAPGVGVTPAPPAARPAPPRWPRPAPAPCRRSPRVPPLAAHRPQNTLVSSRDEADDLRLRISAPGMPADDVEMDLEEVETTSTTRPTPSSCRAAAPDTTAPEPVLQPERAGATEVEVPIDIEVAPGTTRISLNIKLLLSLRRR